MKLNEWMVKRKIHQKLEGIKWICRNFKFPLLLKTEWMNVLALAQQRIQVNFNSFLLLRVYHFFFIEFIYGSIFTLYVHVIYVGLNKDKETEILLNSTLKQLKKRAAYHNDAVNLQMHGQNSTNQSIRHQQYQHHKSTKKNPHEYLFSI